MNVQVEKTGAYLAKMTVTLSQDEVEKAYVAALRRVSKQAQLPGFRPGKIPPALLARNFGAQVHSDVQNKLVEDTLFSAMDDNDVAAVAMPKVSLGHLHRGAQFTYTAEVEVRPDITLTQYKGLAAPAVTVEVEDADVDAQIEAMRKEAAQTVPVVDRKVAEKGDFVLLDYVGSIDGVPFAGGKANNALVELAAADYIDGFAEGIIGAEVPGQRDVSVQFPADYSVDELAGKTAIFAMTFKELKAHQLPTLDDAFAQDMGAESLAGLRTKIRDDLTARKTQEAEAAQRREVLKALVAANPFEVPPSMVDSQVERLVQSAQARVERMTGQKIDLDSQAVAELRGSSRDDAEFQVRSGLLMLAVSKAENIAIEDSAVDAEVEKLAAEAGDQAHLVRSAYAQEDLREALCFRLLEDRVVALLLAEGTQAA